MSARILNVGDWFSIKTKLFNYCYLVTKVYKHKGEYCFEAFVTTSETFPSYTRSQQLRNLYEKSFFLKDRKDYTCRIFPMT